MKSLEARIIDKAKEIRLVPTCAITHYFEGDVPYDATLAEVIERLRSVLADVTNYLASHDQEVENHPDVLNLIGILNGLELIIENSRVDIENVLQPFFELNPDTFQPLEFECDDFDEAFEIASEQTGQPKKVFTEAFKRLKKLQRHPGYLEALERIHKKVLVKYNPFDRGLNFSIFLNASVKIDFRISLQADAEGIRYQDSYVFLVADEKGIFTRFLETINATTRYTFPEALAIMSNFFGIHPFHLQAALTKGPDPETSSAREACCFFEGPENITQLRYEYLWRGKLTDWAILNIIARGKDQLVIAHPVMID